MNKPAACFGNIPHKYCSSTKNVSDVTIHTNIHSARFNDFPAINVQDNFLCSDLKISLTEKIKIHELILIITCCRAKWKTVVIEWRMVVPWHLTDCDWQKKNASICNCISLWHRAKQIPNSNTYTVSSYPCTIKQNRFTRTLMTRSRMTHPLCSQSFS